MELDEARLNDLDRALRLSRGSPVVLAIWAAEHGPKLIATLREAWRERDESEREVETAFDKGCKNRIDFAVEFASQFRKERDEARAEVERLKMGGLATTLFKEYREKIQRFQAVYEAAEDYLSTDPYNTALYTDRERTLRRALDACEEGK